MILIILDENCGRDQRTKTNYQEKRLKSLEGEEWKVIVEILDFQI